MTYIIVCGGTAGHINPGIEIAEGLRRRQPECKILFIGADRELEKRLIPKAGFELINFKMTGIRRALTPKAALYNVKTVLNIFKTNREAEKLLNEIKPVAVIGTGGYICYPVLKTASKKGISTYIHESNALPGMTVRRLSAYTDKVMITYPGFDKFYKRPERIIVTGTPVRKSFFTNQSTSSDNNEPLVVSFWGSLGAENLNEKMVHFIKRNSEEQGFKHIHATGNAEATKVLKEALKETGVTDIKAPYADIRDYIDNVPEIMKSADLIMCRAGGITLAEINAAGKPALLIPSPYVPDNGQQINAAQQQKYGAAIVQNEHECDGESLYDEVISLIKDKDKLQKMGEASKTLAKPNATDDIIDIILEIGN